MSDQGGDPGREPVRIRDLAEDATGFGSAELRMTKDLVLRPQAVLVGLANRSAEYPRPLRYYLTLNALYWLLIAALGGFARAYEQSLPPEYVQPLATFAGKSLEGFYADLDQWFALCATPILALAFYPPVSWLFGRWTRGRLPASGQAFAYLSGWTLWGMPFGLAGIVFLPLQSWMSLISPIILTILYHRMGRGVWWSGPRQWATRYVQLLVTLFLAWAVAVLLIMAVSLAGAVFAP